ncbi:NAD(P)H-binding protein [Streptomyces sp. MTZ3.1]|uniref:NAD(P)H-binding protein n=2 Tax=Streptomyces meridianus TaxID=2938945 RepID=A0ABT0X277_9ACTN|nr:NAD(P)H-binding protein [Streptomyces meridianus]
MNGPVLVTGGTGTLGRAVVRQLLAGGHGTRILSRRPRPADDGSPGDAEWVTGDLNTGEGIDAAVTGTSAIVHCASTGNRKDVQITRNLSDAVLRSAGRPHLVHISIVGIDRVPFFYYRAKLDTERLVATSGLPWSVLRTTQFHDLVALLTDAQRRLPVALTLGGVRFQPIDVDEVAARLVALATGPAVGRADDMGGPQIRDAAHFTRATLRASGRSRRVVPVRPPGRFFRALRLGGNLVPDRAVGRTTFEEYLARRDAPDTSR